MKRHDSLIPLSRQHHDALILAQLIKKNSPPYKGLPTDLEGKRLYTLKMYTQHLVPHFEAEEIILLPFVLGKNRTIDILATEIIDEHKKIAQLIELIRLEDNTEDNLDRLGNLLSSHVRKEERQLFEEIQKVFTEEQLHKLALELAHIDKKKNC